MSAQQVTNSYFVCYRHSYAVVTLATAAKDCSERVTLVESAACVVLISSVAVAAAATVSSHSHFTTTATFLTLYCIVCYAYSMWLHFFWFDIDILCDSVLWIGSCPHP